VDDHAARQLDAEEPAQRPYLGFVDLSPTLPAAGSSQPPIFLHPRIKPRLAQRVSLRALLRLRT
jgi:hypothetical protein